MATSKTPRRKADDYSTPDAATKASQAASKRQEEVKEIQVDTHHDNVTNVPSEPVSTAFGEKPSGKAPVAQTFALEGQEVVQYLENKEIARYGREDWLHFLRHVQQIGTSL